MPNRDEKWRFGLIANSRKIAEDILALTDPATETVRMTITESEDVEDRAAALLAEGCEALIAHGSVGEELLPLFGHLTVNIPKSDRVILNCLREAAEHSRNVAIAMHANENFDRALYESALDMRIEVLRYTTLREISEGVRDLYRRGIPVVLGGGFTCRCIEDAGGTGIMIRPEPRLINLALKQARVIAATKRNEDSRRRQLFSILRLIDEGVVAVDGDGAVLFANTRAQDVFGAAACLEGGIFPKKHADALGFGTAAGDKVSNGETIFSINKKRYVAHALPLELRERETGAVAFIKDVGGLEDINRRVRAALYDRGLVPKYSLDSIAGESSAIQAARQKAALFAEIDAPVLIEGETGTGKELFAHALHQAGPRRHSPFVAVDCSALPESLLESELFGYEEGAFTGARRGGKAGLFEMAHAGTLFIDEIGEMPPAVQQKLLRVLEAKEVMRIGGDRVLPLDVRIITATNRDLAAMVRRNAFRMDLFFRMAGLRLHIPPLRERLEDVPAILAPLLARHGHAGRSLPPALLRAVAGYSWPGNVRELLSLMEAFLALEPGHPDSGELFADLLLSFRKNGLDEAIPSGGTAPMKKQLDVARARIASDAVAACNGNRHEAARKLGVSYNTLWRILGGGRA